MSARHLRIYTVLSDPFRYGFLMMARTLLARNPGLELELCVLHNPELCPLGERTRAWLSARLPNLRFISVDTSANRGVLR